MIVVAGAGLGCAGVVAAGPGLRRGSWRDGAVEVAGFVLMVASGLVLVLRLRRPRPTFRRLTCQPGAVACFAVPTWVLLDVADSLIQEGLRGDRIAGRSLGLWIWYLLEPPSAVCVFVVPIVWGLLVSGRRWRPEPGWIDRTGRVLGWSWLLWGAVWSFL